MTSTLSCIGVERHMELLVTSIGHFQISYDCFVVDADRYFPIAPVTSRFLVILLRCMAILCARLLRCYPGSH